MAGPAPKAVSKRAARPSKHEALRQRLVARLQKRIAAGEAQLQELEQKIRLAEVRIAAGRDVLWLMDTGDFPPISHTEILSGPLARRIQALVVLSKEPMTVAAVSTALHIKGPRERSLVAHHLSALAKQDRGITRIGRALYRGHLAILADHQAPLPN